MLIFPIPIGFAAVATLKESETMTTVLPQINRSSSGSYQFTVVRDGANVLEKPWETFGVDQSRKP